MGWGAATCGLGSPGVAAVSGSQYSNAPYTFLMSGLVPGVYAAHIYAHSTVTNSWNVFMVQFTVTATPLHTLELPAAGAAVTQPFTVSGWALDAQAPTGTGVDAVGLVAYRNYGNGTPAYVVGWATYSGSRPDVAALYGARFQPSGYSLSVTEPPGWYMFLTSSHNVTNNSWTTRTTTAFVDILNSTLTITRGGTGTGGITATPTGLSCPGGSTTQGVPCSAPYSTGTVVTLTAVPDAGSTFAGWVGACSGTGTCPVGMNGDRHVTAMFSTVPGSVTTHYYHTDVIGSVRAITDAAGAVVIRYDNKPFGEDNEPPTTNNTVRFAGKELDAETAMHYFSARYYRNTWGRFTSVDPVMGWLSNPQSFNRYAYALNNPLRFVDPTGLHPVFRGGIDQKWTSGSAAVTGGPQYQDGGSLFSVNGMTPGGDAPPGMCAAYNQGDFYMWVGCPGGDANQSFAPSSTTTPEVEAEQIVTGPPEAKGSKKGSPRLSTRP